MTNNKHLFLTNYKSAIVAIVGISVFCKLIASQQPAAPSDMFTHSSNCQVCHNTLQQKNGDDASIGVHWRSTVMANASNDPYWRASVRREIIEHEGAASAIEDKCATCHMPMTRFTQKLNDSPGTIFNQLPNQIGQVSSPIGEFAKDGVSCTVCHQIEDKKLGEPSSFTGGFHIALPHNEENRTVNGPFNIDNGVAHVMASATGFTPNQATHIQQSEFCATCHTLYTHALDENGNEVGQLAEQVPYLEWKHSDYYEAQSCQECHMKPADGPVPISSVLGAPRDNVQKHIFRGGNFFLLSMLRKFAVDLDVPSSVAELTQSHDETKDQLQSNAASIDIRLMPYTKNDTTITAHISVSNMAGHKLPTAYPSRRVWIQFILTDANDNVVFESGALKDGMIMGNNNDTNGAQYEPHYEVIEKQSQVQIYEAILGDPQNQVTTGLLKATHYIKDNRIPPSGFDKETAHNDIAVKGNAYEDGNFDDGADEITYRIPLSKPSNRYSVTAKLWYQPIGHRWAINLDKYAADEPKQFSKMYHSMNKNESATLLVKATKEMTHTIVAPPVAPTAPSDTDSDISAAP